MRTLVLAVGLIALAAPGAASAAKPAPLTPMQIQAVQMREFEADKQAVFSSVVSVFQDLGYTLNTADVNSGFVVAESPSENKTSFWDALGEVSASGNTRVTAFIEAMPSGLTRLRLNFVSTKNSTSYGQALKKDKPIMEAVVYQRAFEKVDEALFVRKAVNAPTPAAPPAAAAPAVAAAVVQPVSAPAGSGSPLSETER